MVWLSVLLVLMVVVILAAVAMVLWTLRTHRFDTLSKQLRGLTRILLYGTVAAYFVAQVVVIAGYVTDAPVDLWETNRALLPGLLSLKLLAEAIVYVSILIWADKLLKNLTHRIVFVRENALYTRQIGEAFLILFVFEVLGALVLSAAMFLSSGGTFELVTNETMFLQLIIGFVLLIVASLFEQSIQIYEENQLTI
jgi:hypothetical protein